MINMNTIWLVSFSIIIVSRVNPVPLNLLRDGAGHVLSEDDDAIDLWEGQTYPKVRRDRNKATEFKYMPKIVTIYTGFDKLAAPPRCTHEYSKETHRRKRYVLQGKRWKKHDLTYIVRDYTNDLTKKDVDKTIMRALQFWADVTPLRFHQVYKLPADLEIRFLSGKHGDEHPFDGEGVILAHAFPPESSKQGKVHFDEDETWTLDTHKGRNLLYVAVHEFGHSLGLSHSEVEDAIMFPFTPKYKDNLKLHEDDIAGIQKVYGAPGSEAGLLSQRKNYCSGKRIDAATVAVDGRTYLFSGKTVFILKSDGYSVAEEFPQPIWTAFPGGPHSVDAALTYFNRKVTYLFKGNEYWRYSVDPNGNLKADAGYPITIKRGWGMDISDVDAVFIWGNKLYFTKDEYYYVHDGYSPLPGYPQHFSSHKALRHLTQLDAAVKWTNRRHYFFSGAIYYRWKHSSGHGYMTGPLDTAKNWLGCET
ncbi:macrophage metalloelastase [Lingula anatina]|uniref:Macrophage metalloelastase n=1 Tax=Lingula anatina TaxID=7574 RepID=A0A1S3H999_LINAN|nr:macrophage metalloelastase [Lingula anatina]|eukprot:XP_013381704.1 macrophage metalloelastase [Lingula anatina]